MKANQVGVGAVLSDNEKALRQDNPLAHAVKRSLRKQGQAVPTPPHVLEQNERQDHPKEKV